MGSKKKKKVKISKRRAQSQLKKKKKQKRRLIKNSPDNRVSYMERPSFSDMEPPDGFRPVSISQAMMEYAKPVMEMGENQGIEDMNLAMQAGMLLWNYSISLEDGHADKKMKKEIIRLLAKEFDMSRSDAGLFLEQMIERKEHLFPKDIQPKHAMTMFVRREMTHLITGFNYNKIDFSSSPIPPDREDRDMVESVQRMDQYIAGGSDYDTWEDHYFEMEEKCGNRFELWLKEKGHEEYCENFPFYTETYLNFVYRYNHDDLTTLKSITPEYLEEFFADYVLRKVIIEPYEYTLFPPAMKLLYKFLSEKGYMDDHTAITEIIDQIGPSFIRILRKRFG
ncbi:MAG: hypothetical protein H8E19_14400 [Deltaproteobacteria bacterium]|uniref:Uncharacterized protein n=1 Tax=Candidatus Desulfacyla euxinica TaxID=2841693 RepID=A0A8J6N285_9DELT|nr:hypothetical protein [Candidatus Desulfacyla euxinica]